ncbi:WYL domain-containing protein [Marinilabiliaceae bacterium ANBcel2]|nr:WYL domain-containing protein [Marinilabiliaceae bacterium ANBcel2]
MTNRLPQFIDYEKRRPKGTENLNGLLQAIKNNQRVRFTYHKIWTDDTQIRYIEPLALKESINRWYVVACDMEDNKKIKTFALDRISEIINTSEKFIRPNDFDVNELFKYSFGIISGAHFKPEKVKLIFYKPEAEYIRSLRLHHTQKETKETDDEIHFEMTLYITEDFIKEIVSHGSNVKVLKPNSLIRAVKEHHKEALDLY